MKAQVFLAVLLLGGHAARAGSPQVALAATAADSCAAAIGTAEAQFHLPEKLLGTIALVESGRADPVTGRARSWPWTINALGTGFFFRGKEEAIAAVQALEANGVRSIDVGCMQINLMYHPDAFASLEQAFDPSANALYGARFLSALYRQIGSWPQASAAYHSQTPNVGQDYEKRVMALWPLADRYPDAALAARRDGPPAAADDSRYTPEFAAALRQMRADQLALATQHKAGSGLTALGAETPELAALHRRTTADLARLGTGEVSPPRKPRRLSRS